MKTLHLYLTRQVLISLLMTVGVFLFVFVLVSAMKEIIALLVSRQVTLALVVRAFALLLPYGISYVLPFGMLTAVLLVLGRFSADQELTAVRASGVSLIAIVTPILLLSLVLCGLCALFNLWVAPQSRGAYKDLIYQFGTRTISGLITEDRFIDEIPGMILYVRKKNGSELQDVHIYMLKTNQITEHIIAQSGRILVDDRNTTISFELSKVVLHKRNESASESDPELIGPPVADEPSEWNVAEIGKYTTDVDFASLKREDRKPKLSEMTIVQLFRERAARAAQGVEIMPLRVQIHRQLASSFACFAFTLIAIPLAIQAHRRETSIGIAIALVLVMTYYSFIILGEAFSSRAQLYPHILVWVPNFFFEILGGILLYRANRG
jgi:lipopolysaccharide export system permease protein